MKKNKSCWRPVFAAILSPHRAILLALLGTALIVQSCRKAPTPPANSSLKDLIQVRNSGVVDESARPLILNGLASPTEADRVIALSIIGKHPEQCCFAVDALVKLLKESHSSSRILAISVVGKLGPCAKSASDELRSIMTESDVTARVLAQSSLQNINQDK